MSMLSAVLVVFDQAVLLLSWCLACGSVWLCRSCPASDVGPVGRVHRFGLLVVSLVAAALVSGYVKGVSVVSHRACVFLFHRLS